MDELGNMEILNFVQPYGMSAIRSEGLSLAIGAFGSVGLFRSGVQLIGIALTVTLRGAASGQSQRAGMGFRSTATSGFRVSSANFQRAAGSGVLSSGVSGIGRANSSGPQDTVAKGLPVEAVFKVNEGRPNAVDHILNSEIDLVINTPLGKASFFDEEALRRAVVAHGVPYATTLSAASAAVEAIQAMRQEPVSVRSLQEWHAR